LALAACRAEQAREILSTKFATTSDGTPATGTDRFETAVSTTGVSGDTS
jgi:hypothetical protein